MNVKEIMTQLRDDPAYKWCVDNNDVENMQLVLKAQGFSSYNYEFAQQLIINEHKGK